MVQWRQVIGCGQALQGNSWEEKQKGGHFSILHTHETDETVWRSMKSIPPIFLVFSPAMTKHSARQMLCVVRHGDSFRQKRTDWTVPLMWIFGFSGNETEGLEWASSGFRLGPRLCGAPSELATTHSLSVPLILMHLAEALRFVSPREGSPARSKQHVRRHTHTRTHLDGEKRAIGLAAHKGLLTQHSLQRLLEAQAKELFLFVPYFIQNQSYYFWMSSEPAHSQCCGRNHFYFFIFF